VRERSGARARLDDDMIHDIRRKVLHEEFEFSKHATDQSILRNIRADEIRQAPLDGKIIVVTHLTQ